MGTQTPFAVQVLTYEEGRYWQEGTFFFSTKEAAEKAATNLHDEEYRVVICQGNTLVKRYGMNTKDACLYGAPATVGILTPD